MTDQRIFQALATLEVPMSRDVVAGRGAMLFVCNATQREYDAFLGSEDDYLTLRSSHLEWIDGEIYVVEFLGGPKSVVSRALDHAIAKMAPQLDRYLSACGNAYNRDGGLPRYEPDESYGPIRHALELALHMRSIPLPQGVTSCVDFVTLKVEIGLTRGWGEHQPGQLDWKARDVWSRFPGVRYVLCVALAGEDLRQKAGTSFKLYEIPDDGGGSSGGGGCKPRFITQPTPIVAPSTVVEFDTRRLLGISTNVALPPELPDPLQLDLFAVLQIAHRNYRIILPKVMSRDITTTTMMAVNQINHAIHALGRIPSARDVPKDHSLVVCTATQHAWNAFVESDDQAIHSTHMLYLNGEIVVVEFGGRGHSEFTRALHSGIMQIPHIQNFLVPHGSTPTRSLASGVLYQADASYGPAGLHLEPLGVQLPANVAHWYEFMTLKVEVGRSRGFCGDRTPTSLDYKAMHVWSSVPGVAYVLCIAIDDHDLTRATYKLYDVMPPGLPHQIVPASHTFIPTATAIVGPHTVVALDARRLLGLAPGMALPPQFPDPVEIDLYQVLQLARFRAYV